MLRRLIPKTKLFPQQTSLFYRNFHISNLNLSQKEEKQETEFEKALREAKEEPQISKPVAPAKKPLWERIKAEARHYIDGSKLLAAETSISSRLLIKVLKGTTLSRREMRQLKRTTQDLLRLVPLIIILLVPFLEFALPVLLRFFPGMLPSTFESKSQEEERKRNLLKVRVQMAAFLQETVGEVALSGTSKADAAKEFNEFFSKCRNSGTIAPTDELVKISKKLEDELTLNSLSRPQLVSMARFMNLTSFGTDSFLRSIIERQLIALKNDDREIAKDGVDNLSIAELQSACSARGITTTGVSPARMRSELSQWLELHLVHKIPSSLLLLSLAFQTSTKIGGDALGVKAEALQATLSSLPHQVVNEAQLKISEREGVATYKQKLEVLKEQEEMIADELEQEMAVEASKKSMESIVVDESSPTVEESQIVKETTQTPEIQADNSLSQPLPTAELKPVMDALQQILDDKESELSESERKKLSDALKVVSRDSGFEEVKQTLDALKSDRLDFIEDVEEFKQFTQKTTPKSSDRLGSRIDKMIEKIESELTKFDDHDISKVKLKPNLDGQISIEDLEGTLRVIQDLPNDERIKKIIKKLDADGDGKIAIQELLNLVEDKIEGGPEVADSSEGTKFQSAAAPTPPKTPESNI